MWKKEIKSAGGADWIELRKLFNRKPCYGNILIIVSLGDGYFYGNNEEPEARKTKRYSKSSKDVNVRISMNGPIALTFVEWQEIDEEIQKAKQALLDLG